MRYKIRRAVFEDEDLLMSFREKIYPPDHKSLNREYWRWKFLKHPWAKEIPFFVLISDGKIVGTQGYWPVRFNIREQLIDGAMLIDLRVLDSFKGLPAVKLYRAVQSKYIVNMGASLSEDARRFFNSARWVDLSDQVSDLYYLLKLTGAESSFIDKVKFAVRLVEKKIKKMKFAGGISSEYQLKVGDNYPESIESLLQNIQSGACSTFKDVNWLRWRYEQCPIYKYQYASFYSENNLKGVLIFRIQSTPSRKVCQIVDFYCPQEDVFMLLLVKFIEFCQNENFSAIETKTTGNIAKMFLEIGFRKGENSLGLMMHDKDKCLFDEFVQSCLFPFVIGDSDLW